MHCDRQAASVENRSGRPKKSTDKGHLMFLRTQTLRIAVFSLSLLAGPGLSIRSSEALAQAPTAARSTPLRGTVKSIEGSTLTLLTDAGQQMAVTVATGARIQRLAAGSTDLKTAEAAQLSEVAVGDRVLVAGTAVDPSSFSASRLILMKSGDIAQRHEAEQQDWQKRGTAGIVSALDSTSGMITVTSGTRKLQIGTGAKTIYRRYAGGSVRFEDAKPGTLGQIHPGDQMLARGAKSDDGASLQAEEIVSGSFQNLSGTLLSVDEAKHTVSLKDLASKHTVTVQLTPNSALHRLPPEAAARFAVRAHAAAVSPAGAPAAANPVARPAPSSSADSPASPRPGAEGHAGGGDLSQVVARLPAVPPSDLHAGDAVMIVAEQASNDTSNSTVVTLLAGVEPILAAAPNGSSAVALSPWSVGSSAAEGGGPQ